MSTTTPTQPGAEIEGFLTDVQDIDARLRALRSHIWSKYPTNNKLGWATEGVLSALGRLHFLLTNQATSGARRTK